MTASHKGTLQCSVLCNYLVVTIGELLGREAESFVRTLTQLSLDIIPASNTCI